MIKMVQLIGILMTKMTLKLMSVISTTMVAERISIALMKGIHRFLEQITENNKLLTSTSSRMNR